ncbi:MAG: class I tRNA ligase family protein, partial [Candidatus Uhrbacteria bacterium]
GLVEKIDEDYVHRLSTCYRCGTAIEPLPKLQWFINVNKEVRDGKSMKDLALEAVRSKQITILPERFEKDYFHWVENLHNWCISRQIWFGHRLPVWYRNNEVYVGREAPEGDGWEQDPDTLDTWFSAGMWTFSTLGWPEETDDFKTFHPTSVLETGYDIIFFWVARMILMTEFALGEVPFKTVYLHGLVRDMKGRKMSKSFGNGIDPLDMINKHGADATRLALFIGTSPGADTKLDEKKIAGYAKFVTKLWNIARYVSMTLQQETGDEKQETAKELHEIDIAQCTASDHWILGKLRTLIDETTRAYEQHEYSKAAQAVYDFAWHDFADWYVEATKIGDGDERQKIILIETLEIILKLLHPAMPFVTEELWERFGGTQLISAAWPTVSEVPEYDAQQADAFVFAQECATAIRQARVDAGIAPKDAARATIALGDADRAQWTDDVQRLVAHFGRVELVEDEVRGTQVTVRQTTLSVERSPISK